MHWVHVHPHGGEKIVGANAKFRGESSKCNHRRQRVHSDAEQESIFRKSGISGRWERLFRQFGRVLKATAKKVNFSGKKSAPQTKSWLRL